MLQNKKEKIADFDAWYEEGWRKRMKADPIMAWLNDARTKVEHIGDLDLASTAVVTVIANWIDGPYAVFEVPPHVVQKKLQKTLSQPILLTGFAKRDCSRLSDAGYRVIFRTMS